MPVIISGSQGTTTISGSGVSGSLTVTGSLIVSGSNTITNYGAFTSNEAGGDFDFRVESSGEPNMLFVDAGENRVGIGTVSPSKRLHVSGSVGDASILVESDSKTIELLPANGPSIRFGTDTDTDYYMSVGAFGGYNQISLQHGYTDFQITGSLGGIGYYFDQPGGNVGIGTQAPSASLHVSSSGDAALLQVDGAANGTVLFVTGSGQVGVGTTSPASRLHISASTESLSGEKLLEVTGKANGTVLFVTGSGRVGIGTAAPTRMLDIEGGDSAGIQLNAVNQSNAYTVGSDGYGFTIFEDAGLGTAGYRMVVADGGGSTTAGFIGMGSGVSIAGSLYPSAQLHVSSSNNQAVFRVDHGNSLPLLFATGSGRVGIGTTSPASRLHISASTESLSGEKLLEVTGKANGTVLFVTGSGRVGIGTATPATTLDIIGGASGDQLRFGHGPTNYYKIGRNTSTGYLDFQGTQGGYTGYTFKNDDGSTDLTILDSGYVGIGTATPNSTFQVSGSQAGNYTVISGSMTLDETHYIADLTGGIAATVTLPAASGVTGRTYHILTTYQGDEVLTITGSGGQFMGSSQQAGPEDEIGITGSAQSVTLVSTGAYWFILTDNRQQQEEGGGGG